MKKIKVVWICSFSNAKTREHYKVKYSLLERLAMRCVGRQPEIGVDTAKWNNNALKEMEKRADVELHVISPIRNLSEKVCTFEMNGIHYHFFRDENSSLFRKVSRYLFSKDSSLFTKNRKHMRQIMADIKPDIVHVMGAENPYYSLGLLEVPKGTPTILQLQAFLATIVEKASDDVKRNYEYKANLERLLISKADYVGTCATSFIEYLRANVKPDAVVVNTTLAMAQEIDIAPTTEKKYDFVHYAACLCFNKATDVAVKAFAEVHKIYPEVTLELIGRVQDEVKPFLEETIEKEGLQDVLIVHGLQKTHADVIKLVRQARFALLPLKTSLVPNTLHEAMANGLPLLTTVTPGTPKLNEKRQSCLISDVGDYKDIAQNMIRLIEDDNLAETLRQNAAITERERENNHDIVAHWVEVYQACIKNKREGVKMPTSLLN